MNRKQSAAVLLILNYNVYDTTLKLIETVKQYQCFDKIIVIDNCSTDVSYEILKKKEDDKVDVIRSKVNGGYAKGNNYGAKYAIEHYNPRVLLFANPDVSFDEATASQMIDFLIDNQRYAVVTALVNKGYNVWNLPTYWGIIESLFLIIHNVKKRKLKNKLIKEKGVYSKVGVVAGSLFAIRTEAFEKVKGFDERTFLYEEENILAYKLNKAGYSEAVLTKARYDHFHSTSIKRNIGGKTKSFRYFHSSIDVYLKYYLYVGTIKRVFFEICYKIALLERMVYDICYFLKG